MAEQTLGAFRVAVEQGADALECDVRLTADAELVCLHDRALARTGGSTGTVSTMTLEQLRTLDWGAWRHDGEPGRRPDSGRLVTLRELVELAMGAGRELGLLIETKHPNRYGPQVEHELARLLAEYGLAGRGRPGLGWVRMMSFSRLAVRRMASRYPDLPCVFLTARPVPLSVRIGGLPAGATTAGLDIAIVRERPETVAAQHAAGHEVFVWTVDDDADIRRCVELGVEGIISNRPRHVIDVVGRNR